MRTKLVIAGIVVVLGAGIAVVALRLMGGGEPDAANLVPANAIAYVDVSLDPSLSQKRAIGSLAERLPEEAQDQLTEAIPKGLNSLFEEIDLDYEKDVKPWLGDEVAGFIATANPEPSGAVLLATTDPDAALAAAKKAVEKEAGPLEDATHREVTYSTGDEGELAIVGDYLVIGMPDTVQSVIDASLDGGLSGTEAYSDLVGSLEPDRVVTYWVDTPAIFDELETTQGLSAAEQEQFAGLVQFQTTTAGSVFATSETVVFESVNDKPDDADAEMAYTPSDPELLGRSPASAWFGFVVPEIGTNAKKILDVVAKDVPVEREFRKALGLDLNDVLAWMGDAALYVGGNQISNLSGALAVTSSDAAETEKFVTALINAGTAQGLAVRSTTVGDLKGFEVADPNIPVRMKILGGDRLVLAVDSQGAGENSTATAGVTGAGDTLADDATYTEAGNGLGSGYSPIFYLDVKRATEVVKSAFGQSSTPPEFVEAEQYISRVAYLVAGTRDDNERVLQRFVIGTADP